MSEQKTVILVLLNKSPKLMPYAEMYKVFPDTEDGIKSAIKWAKENGYDSMFSMGDVGKVVGMVSQYRCGDVDVMIMKQVIEEV